MQVIFSKRKCKHLISQQFKSFTGPRISVAEQSQSAPTPERKNRRLRHRLRLQLHIFLIKQKYKFKKSVVFLFLFSSVYSMGLSRKITWHSGLCCALINTSQIFHKILTNLNCAKNEFVGAGSF